MQKKKIIYIVMFIIILLTFFINTKSYASIYPNYSEMYNNCVDDLLLNNINFYDYICISGYDESKDENRIDFIFFANSDYTCYVSENNYLRFNYYVYYSFRYGNNTDVYKNYNYKENAVVQSNHYLNDYTVIYSSFDVKDNNGSLFFQKTPVPKILTQMMTKVLEEEQVERKTQSQIIQLLPLIIVVVVCFLGLRKALRILLQFLRRS